MSQIHDTIIVGGGPAGAVLAARLTEDSNRRVMLVEAGPDYGSDIRDWPEELHSPDELPTDSHQWGFSNTPTAAGHIVDLPRAKILGGSATINGCVWNRGSRADYDYWEELGNPGWGWEDLLPYFKKAEADPIGNPDLHGEDGPVPVWRVPDDDAMPFFEALISACDEFGIAHVADLNGSEAQFPSIGKTPRNVASPVGYPVRMNPALTYLAMARERSNLEIVADTLIDRVLIEQRRALGVRTADGRDYRADQVILCGGAYQSPAILLRSGIGPASHLSDIDIDVIHDLPGVGESLMDHPLCDIVDYRIKPEYIPTHRIQTSYLIKARSRQVNEEIDLHLYNGQWIHEDYGVWTFRIVVSLQLAHSKGWVRLTSADPEATLNIDHRYFSDPVDLEAMCDGVELAEQLIRTAPLPTMLELDDPLPEPVPRNRDELRKRIRETGVGTTFHPSTTCKMGPSSDPMAVVDQAGRVYGVNELRVVDASIMPYGPRCNLHFPIVAIAEKIADMIRAE